MKKKILIGVSLLLIIQISIFAQSSFRVTYSNPEYKNYIQIGTFTNLNVKGVGVLTISYRNISYDSIMVRMIVYDNTGHQVRDFETWSPVNPLASDFIALHNVDRSEVARVHVQSVRVVEYGDEDDF